MKTVTDEINLDDEVKAIAAYIGLKWTPIANLEQLVYDVRFEAEKAARALFEDHPVWNVAVDAIDARVAMLNVKYGAGTPTLRYYDAGCQMLDEVQGGSKDVREAALNLDGEWDYGRRVSRIHRSLKEKYADLQGTRPHGWAELEKDYNDFDGQEEYDCRPDRTLFQGTKMEGVLSGDFVFRTALPYVMYDDFCQGRKADYTLVGAIFSQFMGLIEHLNTRKICRDIEELAQALPQEHVYDLTLQPKTTVLKVLARKEKPYLTREDYEESVAQMAAYAALSAAEKASYEEKNEASMAEFMTQLTSQTSESIRKERDERIARVTAVLKSALGE